MSKEIVIDAEAFLNTINSINNIVNNLEAIKSEITNANNELKGNWKGKSSKAFFKESENISNAFTDYTEGLASLSNDLETVFTEFTNADSKISTRILGGK